MKINFNFSNTLLKKIHDKVMSVVNLKSIVGISIMLSCIATYWAFKNDLIVTYGDAESHLNIAKRVLDSITPGAAQLGGIWLPVPHVLLIPFVSIDYLWRTGLAGSIVSGIAFVISSVFVYKTAYFLTKNKLVSLLAFIIFAFNPNILYIQTTPMTEMVLIMFFMISSYFYIKFVTNTENTLNLIFAAFFAFIASLSRYDGWFLVLFEALGIIILYLPDRKKWRELEGKLILFCTLAFFGIALWFLWDWIILGDPLFFTNSQFSAKTQQQNWQSKGELPAYHNIFQAVAYYFVTGMSNSGVIAFFTAIIGLFFYLKNEQPNLKKYIVALILLVPFTFNVITLFLGQSVIFIPHLTPVGFEWRLFNVRYGIMIIPTVAIFFAYIWHKQTPGIRALLIGLLAFHFLLYPMGYSRVISLEDGTAGLSKAKRPDAEGWIKTQYDGGLVLIDDYARTVSIVRSGIPMQNIIYIGNQYYWSESFSEPEKYAKWIIMQKDDAVWKGIYDKPKIQARLFKYFNKVYTSPEILIFRRIDKVK